jgi:hypothetical protein
MNPKAIQYLATLALVLTCVVAFALMHVFAVSLTEFFVNRGRLIPAVTAAVVLHPWWPLLVPVPVLLYLYLTRKAELSLVRAIMFAELLVIITVPIIGLCVFACVVPWLPLPI